MAYFSFLQVPRPSLPLSLPPPSIFTTLPSSISISLPSSDSGLGNFPQLKTLHTHPSFSVRCMGSPDVYQVIDIEAEWVRDADPEPPETPEIDNANTPYIPVYVMLPLGVINVEGELNDQKWLTEQLKRLKDANVDGVMVDCWWGIVERDYPEEYNWDGYKMLFQIVRELNLKLKVAMSFHECGGNCGEDVHIPLPRWVTEIGKSNPDIFFTDVEGRRFTECLSWGIDRERVLRGRTAIEVHFDYMRSFRTEFNVFFQEGIISEIQVGLGPCGELHYPSHPKFRGWEFIGIGGFQCYDQYLVKSLRKEAEANKYSLWEIVPKNARSYYFEPDDIDTGSVYDRLQNKKFYNKFFLRWYYQVLVNHADLMLNLAKLAFEGTCIAAKMSGAHWLSQTTIRVAELASGFYNPSSRDGYASIASMLQKNGAALNFTCVEQRTMMKQDTLSDPVGVTWQVVDSVWYSGIPAAGENAFPCYKRADYNKILENAKREDELFGRQLSAFNYMRLGPDLMGHHFSEFKHFVKRMHGEATK